MGVVDAVARPAVGIGGTAGLYHGPPAFGWPSAADRWTFDPAMVALAMLIVAGYLAGVVRVRRGGGAWPLARTASFLAGGVGLLLLSSVWWVGVYSRVLFWDFTVQVLLLLIVAPVFLAFGRPLSLAVAAGGRPAAAVRRLRRAPAFHLGSHPAFGPLLVPLVVFGLFFTGLLAATQRDAAVGEVVRLALALVGFVVALPLAGDDGGTVTGLAIAAGLFLGFLELLLDAVPGILVRLRGGLLAPGYYGGLHRPWGPSPLSDQHAGGALLWGVAEVVDLPFLVLLLTRWIRVDAAEAARVDEELDAQAAARRVVQAVVQTTAEPELTQPWWETNPEYLGPARAARIRRDTAGRDAGRGGPTEPPP